MDILIAKMREQGGRCATITGRCSYEDDGKKCLFSMALTDEARDLLKDHNPSARAAFSGEYELDLDNTFLEGYEGYDVAFWQDVQSLHDNMDNWNPDLTLTTTGKDKYARLVG